jgi:hypothetical protein
MTEQDSKAGTAQQPRPGQVVTPGSNQVSGPQQAVDSAPVSSTSSAVPAQPAPERQQSSDRTFQTPFNQQESPSPGRSPDGEVSWTASEFVAHEKSSGWYLGLFAAAAVIAGFVYLLTRDIISTIVVLIGAGALGTLANRKPRQLEYHLDGGGITVGQKHYAYESFRSFSVVPEGAFSSIVFMPLKRFAQTTTIYYAPEDEDKIIDVLTQHLPFEEHKADAVDSLMRRIRF